MSVGSWINLFLAPVAGLFRRVPGRVWLAAGCLLIVSFWVQQHDAGVRRQAQLQQVRQQTEVAALKKQAQQEIAQANVENAQAIQKLEARRQQIEQQNQKLAAQLAALRKQEQVQAGEVATLPVSEIVAQVATQLGLKAGEDVVPHAGTADIAKSATSGPPNGGQGIRQGSKARAGFLAALGMTQSSHGKAPGAKDTTSAPPPSMPLSQTSQGTRRLRHPARGEDAGTSTDIAKSATAGPPAATKAGDRRSPLQKSTAATGAVAMALTGSGARKVERALVGLKACQAESNIQTQQVSNCQARTEADDATIQRQASSIASLNQALAAKDQISSKQESECQAELRAAKGTFWSRLARAAKHVAIGVGVGLVIGVAAR